MLDLVTEYSPQDVAERAGVEPDYVRHLLALQILSLRGEALSAGDVPRVRLIQSLDRAGVPLEGIATAIREGHVSLAFMDSPFYERFASLSRVSFQELAQERGIPIELLTVIREAIGWGQPAPEDRVREDELRIVPTIQLLLETGTRPAVAERLLRVYGESMRRIAEMEGHWWHSEMELPLLEAGMSEKEMMETTNRVGFKLASSQEEALVEIYRAYHEHAATKNMAEDIERALAKAGVHSRLERPPAISFVDITGYTRLTEARGDEAAADLAGRVARLVERTSRQHGGRPIKWLGDGVMLHFPEPGPGVMAALEVVEGVEEMRLPPAHVGLHAGPVLFQEADYFGRTVNIAARIADFARPGEVVVSQAVADATAEPSVAFTEIGPVELKGTSGPLQLHTAKRRA